MSSIRKREWGPPDARQRAWIFDHRGWTTDRKTGERKWGRIFKTFKLQREAEAYRDSIATEITNKAHIGTKGSATVAEAGKRWIELAETDGLERATLKHYRLHLNRHIVPFIGTMKLSEIGTATVGTFETQLRQSGRSSAMIKKARSSLAAIIGQAQTDQLINRNPVKEANQSRRKRERGKAKRAKRKLEAGVDFPTKAEIRGMIDHAQTDAEAADQKSRRRKMRANAILVTAVFTGMRVSELRGMAWKDVDLKNSTIHVRQKADEWRTLGAPKSAASRREIPLAPRVVSTLRTWKLQCPQSARDLVFPNDVGNVEDYNNWVRRWYKPLQVASGVAVNTDKRDDEGKPIKKAKYGFHALRHAAASLFIDSGKFTPKRLQEIMGHSSIQMTFDTYGHLFPNAEDDQERMASIERDLLA